MVARVLREDLAPVQIRVARNFMQSQFPQHIAVIPDGNRRWARARGLYSGEGHREGAKRFHEVFAEAVKIGIPYFTFWAASESNLLERNRLEVKFLVKILKEALRNKSFREILKKNGTRVQCIGRWNEILKDAALERAIQELEAETGNYRKNRLTMLLGYDGRWEMIEAVNKLKAAGGKRKIDYDDLSGVLWTGDLPPVDLVIRTGGEPHWSAGFMMWLTADSQFYFTEKFWPDFGKNEFKKALADYTGRERRLGC